MARRRVSNSAYMPRLASVSRETIYSNPTSTPSVRSLRSVSVVANRAYNRATSAAPVRATHQSHGPPADEHAYTSLQIARRVKRDDLREAPLLTGPARCERSPAQSGRPTAYQPGRRLIRPVPASPWPLVHPVRRTAAVSGDRAPPPSRLLPFRSVHRLRNHGQISARNADPHCHGARTHWIPPARYILGSASTVRRAGVYHCRAPAYRFGTAPCDDE
jgi:hypothetical protein